MMAGLPSLIHIIVLASAIGTAAEVLTLDTQTMGEAIFANPLMLVNFYAPWCGHSKQLEPEFEKAAEHLRGRVTLAKVDATMEVELTQQYRVDGYPAVFFFKNGEYEEYTGARQNASIVRWVEEHSGPAITVLASEEELQKTLVQRVGTGSSYFVARGTKALQELFRQVAEMNRALGLFLFVENLAADSHVVQVHRGIDEVVELRGEAELADQARVTQFLQKEFLPPFGEITEDNYAAYLARSSLGLLWVCIRDETFEEDTSRLIGPFREVAANFPQLPMVYINARTYKEHIQDELGCVEFPTAVLQLGNLSAEDVEPDRYRMVVTGEASTAASLSAWITEVLAGRVQADELDDPQLWDEEGDEWGGESPAEAASEAASTGHREAAPAGEAVPSGEEQGTAPRGTADMGRSEEL
mmetsp:Transcript_120687/g.303519  ORF Transcript_120687/g.303519 Transcript_120687/m.303519 type:complete len:414 (+) Transcript_120687:96-1337(+)|eukprot:CAMPEP_0115377552 /NCGR_PEP_ID=MMETSP0271-20121206/3547_1 /TAXON_ID=71861 /ORGANISM="Scrippsiella trochoidea, Strain CCMP3099" /LENGTH=413 /DNA_ID=CAMNT_0002800671 /DNA_START=50 /DNA_END=1291 /DNA_ORIENTATION=-